MKQLYSSLGLLLVVAVVGGWIYFNERGPIADTGSTVLLRADPTTVNTISLQRPDAKPVTLTRQGENWRVQQQGLHPVAVPADSGEVKALLNATQLIESAALVKNAAAGDFGLTRPQSTLIVGDAKLEFGNRPSFDQSRVYARVTSSQTKSATGGVQIALLPATLGDFSSKAFDEWRDKSVLHVTPVEVTQLQLHSPQMNARFERTEVGGENELDKWKLTSPVAAPADAGTIVTLLQELQSTKITKFLEDNPRDVARWGLKKPWAEVDLTTSAGAHSLKIGRVVAGGRAAQNSISNAVFVVPATMLPVVTRPMRDWRDKSILKFDKSQITAVRVQARGQSATFENIPTNIKTPWKRVDGAAQTSAEVASRNMLDVSLGLDGLKAYGFVDAPGAPKTYGFEAPLLEIGLKSNEWQGETVLQLGEKNGKMFARVGREGHFAAPVYEVETSALAAFAPALDSLFPASRKRATSTD